MSEPVSNSEIEDVLTSIRRLVSENRVQTQKAELSSVSTDTESEVAEDATPSALILTPALRVAETPKSEDEETSEKLGEEVPVHADPLEQDGAGDNQVLGVQEDEGLTLDDEDNQDANFHEVEISEAEVGRADATLTLESDDDDEEAFDQASQSETIEDVELGASEDMLGTEPKEEAIHLDQTQGPADFSEDIGGSFKRGGVPDAQLGSEEYFTEDLDEAEQSTPFDFKSVLGARIVHWRDGEAEELPSEREFSSSSDDDYAGTEIGTPAWQPEPEPEGVEDVILDALDVELEEEFAEELHGDVLDGLADAAEEGAVIDEDMLREMVSDIVRQELQGALGERITRNVRKLVRREIHRALAAHDLD